MYFDDDSNLVAVRMNNWKIVFFSNNGGGEGTMRIWGGTLHRVADTEGCSIYEPTRSSERISPPIRYYDWFISKAPRSLPLRTDYRFGGRDVATFVEFPPRQKAASSHGWEQAHEKMGSTTAASQVVLPNAWSYG